MVSYAYSTKHDQAHLRQRMLPRIHVPSFWWDWVFFFNFLGGFIIFLFSLFFCYSILICTDISPKTTRVWYCLWFIHIKDNQVNVVVHGEVEAVESHDAKTFGDHTGEIKFFLNFTAGIFFGYSIVKHHRPPFCREVGISHRLQLHERAAVVCWSKGEPIPPKIWWSLSGDERALRIYGCATCCIIAQFLGTRYPPTCCESASHHKSVHDSYRASLASLLGHDPSLPVAFSSFLRQRFLNHQGNFRFKFMSFSLISLGPYFGQFLLISIPTPHVRRQRASPDSLIKIFILRVYHFLYLFDLYYFYIIYVFIWSSIKIFFFHPLVLTAASRC